MELSARGWKRDHGSKVIAQKNLMEAEIGSFEKYFPSSTYITATDERAEIRFAGKMNLNGDYLVRLTQGKREIAKLFFLVYSEFDEMLYRTIISELNRENMKAIEARIDPELLRKNIDELKFSRRTSQGLRYGDIVSIGDLIQRTEAGLLKLPSLGRISLREIKKALADRGLHLMSIPDSLSNSATEIVISFRMFLASHDD